MSDVTITAAQDWRKTPRACEHGISLEVVVAARAALSEGFCPVCTEQRLSVVQSVFGDVLRCPCCWWQWSANVIEQLESAYRSVGLL